MGHVPSNLLATQFTNDEFDECPAKDKRCEFQVSRQTRDCADTNKIIEYFKKSNPF